MSKCVANYYCTGRQCEYNQGGKCDYAVSGSAGTMCTSPDAIISISIDTIEKYKNDVSDLEVLTKMILQKMKELKMNQKEIAEDLGVSTALISQCVNFKKDGNRIAGSSGVWEYLEKITGIKINKKLKEMGLRR